MLRSAERAVETMIAGGARLDQIEAHIDELPLDSEERSALWLLAWAAETNSAIRRRIVVGEHAPRRPS
jgi:phage-related baseplate assembly protein